MSSVMAWVCCDGHFADFAFVERAVDDLVPQLRVALRHLQHQRLDALAFPSP